MPTLRVEAVTKRKRIELEPSLTVGLLPRTERVHVFSNKLCAVEAGDRGPPPAGLNHTL